ncbi:MAG: hypothetical protein U1F15_10195 [Burkholderiales bacterium]
MSRTPPPSADAAVEAAIERVLSAERQARDAVEQAARDAAALADAARADARAVAERTDRRIRNLRATFATRAEREIAALDAEAALQDAARELSAADLERLAQAVDALARDLTSGPA